MAASEAVKFIDGAAVGFDNVVDECGGRFIHLAGLSVGHEHDTHIELARRRDGLAHGGTAGGYLHHVGVFLEKRVFGIVGYASVEAEQVVAHYFVLMDVSGVDAFAAHARESFPEVAVPGFAAHLAVGDDVESGLDFAVDEPVDHAVFYGMKLVGRDDALTLLLYGLFKLLGWEKTAYDFYAWRLVVGVCHDTMML